MTTLKISNRGLNNLIKKLSIYTHYYNESTTKPESIKQSIEFKKF